MHEGSYLRVLTPKTVDGINLMYGPDNRTPQFSEAHLPLTARKHIERQNDNLPAQLKHIIEVVESAPVNDSEAPEIKEKGKPGPKPKEKIS